MTIGSDGEHNAYVSVIAFVKVIFCVKVISCLTSQWSQLLKEGMRAFHLRADFILEGLCHIIVPVVKTADKHDVKIIHDCLSSYLLQLVMIKIIEGIVRICRGERH